MVDELLKYALKPEGLLQILQEILQGGLEIGIQQGLLNERSSKDFWVAGEQERFLDNEKCRWILQRY